MHKRTLHTLIQLLSEQYIPQAVNAAFIRGEWMESRKHFNKMSLADFWIVLLGCLALCHAAPTIAPTVSPEDKDLAEGYLFQFYADVGMKNSSMRSITENSFSQDLQAMQAFFGLEVTGVLNEETVEVVKAPRCGVPDISRYEHFPFKPKWGKRLITYRITQYTPDLTQRQVDATIAQAFQLYSDVIPLDFKQVYNDTADIMILFKVKYHGDFQSFDGQGGVLAHAYAPGEDEGGDTHFDDDETWTLTQGGVNLLLVAAHEFGHALGLDHSRDRQALMYPIYKYVNTSGYRLPDDDRHGIQALYGNSDPVSSGPGSSDPGNSDPGSSDPGNSDPGNSDPVSSGPGSSGPGRSDPVSSGPDECCFEFYPRRLPKNRVVRYKYTDPLCSKKAVIFTMISGAEICTNPSEQWVKNIINAKEWDHTNTAVGVKSN